MDVHGRVASLFIVGAALGEMLIPGAAAQLMARDLRWLWRGLFLSNAAGLLVYVALVARGRTGNEKALRGDVTRKGETRRRGDKRNIGNGTVNGHASVGNGDEGDNGGGERGRRLQKKSKQPLKTKRGGVTYSGVAVVNIDVDGGVYEDHENAADFDFGDTAWLGSADHDGGGGVSTVLSVPLSTLNLPMSH
jgi:hypothetical protein